MSCGCLCTCRFRNVVLPCFFFRFLRLLCAPETSMRVRITAAAVLRAIMIISVKIRHAFADGSEEQSFMSDTSSQRSESLSEPPRTQSFSFPFSRPSAASPTGKYSSVHSLQMSVEVQSTITSPPFFVPVMISLKSTAVAYETVRTRTEM